MKPVQTELFRFISVRPVQLIDPIKKEIAFVRHPDFSRSHFLNGISMQIEEARKQVLDRKKSYQSNYSIRTLQDQFPELYQFSIWLSRNRSQFSSQLLRERGLTISFLTLGDEVLIWDQLFSQIISATKPTLKQACANMLVANHFLKAIQTKPLEELAVTYFEESRKEDTTKKKVSKLVKRLARAKILVPSSFSKEKDPQLVEELHKPSDGEKKPSKKNPSRYLQLGNENARASREYRELMAIKNDLKSNLIHGIRNSSISKALKNQRVVFSPMTKSFLGSQVNQKEKIADLYSFLNDRILEVNRINRTTNEELLDVPGRSIEDYCYLLNLIEGRGKNGFTFSIKVPNSSIHIEGIQLAVSLKNQVLAQSSSLIPFGNDTLIKTYSLFSDVNIKINQDIDYDVAGSCTLSNGVVIQLSGTLSSEEPTFYGCTNEESSGEEIESIGSEGDESKGEQASPELYGVNHIGLGIFRKVEQEVCCYVPGEVSHIENIMAREYKERSTRNFTSTETTVESSLEIEAETSSDTATTVRNEIQKSVNEVINSSNNLGVGASAGVEGKTPYGKFSAAANMGYAMTNAAATSDNEATVYAQQITSSAAERVLQKTSEKRTSKILKEFEEKIRHGYDNREGKEHVTGIYRWIDIIYTNKLINYGAMEMVEFLIPEPSRFYKETLLGVGKEEEGSGDSGENDSTGSDQKKTLDQLGINGPQDIRAYSSEVSQAGENNDVGDFYQDLASYYGITIPGPLQKEINKPILMSSPAEDHKTPSGDTGQVLIEDTYIVKRMEFSGHFVHNPGNDNNPSMFSISAAGEIWNVRLAEKNTNKDVFTYNIPAIDQDRLDEIADLPIFQLQGASLPDKTIFEMDDYENGMIVAELTAHRTISYSVVVDITAEITPEELLDWKTEAFEALEEASNALNTEQDQEPVEEAQDLEEELAKLATGNSALNRRVEIRELKRAAIEMITRPFGNIIGAKFLDYGQCNVNFPRQNKEWEIYSSHVKFFEQAFHWDIMAYHFYPYFWAQRCDWKHLIQTEDPMDQIFESFLQSGMARMIVPVRPGFEAAVNYYLETGIIWNGGDLVLDTDDELYISIDEEIQEPESFVEKEWDTRIPTSLTLIQGKSAYLDDQGLPCCEKIESTEKTGIGLSEALLGVVSEKS